MTRVLVTGATGFLGGHVVRRLARLGVPVLAMGRNPVLCGLLEREGIAVWRGDLSGPLDHCNFAGVTSVVHCAALSAPFGSLAAFEAANVAATRNLLDLAARQGVRRFVQISSPSVCFAPRDQLGVSEDMPLPAPFTPYARTKRAAELLVLARAEVGPVILRPRGIYGAGDTALLPRLLRAAKARPLPLFRDGAARIDLTHVEDVTDAIVAALNAGAVAVGQIFHVSGGQVLPVTEIAAQVCARAGVALRWRALPLRPAMLAAGLMEAVALRLPGQPEPLVTRYGLALFAYAQSLDIGKARRGLGWVPRIGFDEGLDRTFAGFVP